MANQPQSSSTLIELNNEDELELRSLEGDLQKQTKEIGEKAVLMELAVYSIGYPIQMAIACGLGSAFQYLTEKADWSRTSYQGAAVSAVGGLLLFNIVSGGFAVMKLKAISESMFYNNLELSRIRRRVEAFKGKQAVVQKLADEDAQLNPPPTPPTTPITLQGSPSPSPKAGRKENENKKNSASQALLTKTTTLKTSTRFKINIPPKNKIGELKSSVDHLEKLTKPRNLFSYYLSLYIFVFITCTIPFMLSYYPSFMAK